MLRSPTGLDVSSLFCQKLVANSQLLELIKIKTFTFIAFIIVLSYHG
jgi:hypothetical protein